MLLTAGPSALLDRHCSGRTPRAATIGGASYTRVVLHAQISRFDIVFGVVLISVRFSG